MFGLDAAEKKDITTDGQPLTKIFTLDLNPRKGLNKDVALVEELDEEKADSTEEVDNDSTLA